MSDEPAWEDIRRAYENHAIPVSAIFKMFNIKPHKFYARINAEAWPRRPVLILRKLIVDAPLTAAASAPIGIVEPSDNPPPPDAALKVLKPIAHRRALVQRLTNAIDTKLKLLERRFERELVGLDTGKGVSAADFERDTRTIGTLIKNLEQVTDYDHDHQLGKRAGTNGSGSLLTGAAAKSASAAAAALADEADRLRRELAERLRRLVDPAG